MTQYPQHRLTLVCRLALLGALLSGCGAALHAQQVYRIVGPDGKVSFSDRPPPSADARSATAVGTGTAPVAGNPALPLELRDAVSRYPVTLYTGPGCAPCNTGRALLIQRGVPFTERTVSTNDDMQALQKISGDNTLPFATMGRQQFKGYSDVEWGEYLDAAGYPRTSKLPGSYRNPPPAPLVVVSKPPVATPADAAASRSGSAENRTAPPPPPAPNANPAGIRF